ncbi:integrase core domain-containing protein, partial [Sphingopyxis bauzanensis]|uniref:integrase core domain-containing protein n=1 Tax=Sphingopyxis bauzanensis TaxID=651663 RepID=UPI001E30B974
RCQPGGCPGERSFLRVHRSEARLWAFIATSSIRVLRRPVESAQYLAMNYTQRLAEAKLVPSVGSVGDSYDNALAETINGLYKAEVIWRQRSWPSASAVEMATLNWVEWFNNHRLFGPIGYIPPAEAEANYYATVETLDMVA